jgi:dipeptidase E
MRLLLISNLTNPGEPYLEYPKNNIKEFLGNGPIRALFIPWAAVTFTYDEYERRVAERFNEIGHEIFSIHRSKDPVEAINSAEAIITGGGNTWKLLKMIQENRLIGPVREKVLGGDNAYSGKQ